MEAAISPLPDGVEALRALVVSMAAELAAARAQASASDALIAHLKLQIAKLRREQYGPRAERSRRLLDQLELQLESSRPLPAKMISPRRWPPRRPRALPRLSASAPPGSRFPNICRASASSFPRRARADHAVRSRHRGSAEHARQRALAAGRGDCRACRSDPRLRPRQDQKHGAGGGAAQAWCGCTCAS